MNAYTRYVQREVESDVSSEVISNIFPPLHPKDVFGADELKRRSILVTD